MENTLQRGRGLPPQKGQTVAAGVFGPAQRLLEVSQDDNWEVYHEVLEEHEAKRVKVPWPLFRQVLEKHLVLIAV